MRAAMPAAPASTPARPGARVGAAQFLELDEAALCEALLAAEVLEDRTLWMAEDALEATEEEAELAPLEMLDWLEEAEEPVGMDMPAWPPAEELVPDDWAAARAAMERIAAMENFILNDLLGVDYGPLRCKIGLY
jgi:hypothetical protein